MTIAILANSITQFQLSRYASIANQLESLKTEQAQLQAQLIAALSSGATVEAGARSASLKTCERRSVSWRSVVERLKGAGYVSNALAHTKPSSYIKLILK